MKNSKEFTFIYNKSNKRHTYAAVIFYLESDQNKVGFTASKKIGNAVKRNFSKRRLRSVFSELAVKLKSGRYIFVAKKDILTIEYKKLKNDIFKALKKMDAIKK